jgi:hypothetical protein
LTSFEKFISVPQEELDRLIDGLVKRGPGLTQLIDAKLRLNSEDRRNSLFGISPPMPGLPVLLMRRKECRNSLLGHKCDCPTHPKDHPYEPKDIAYWTLLGPWTEALYDSALALPPENTQRWEAVGAVRPFSVVHIGVVAPTSDKPGFGPQVMVQPRDVEVLIVRPK